MYVFGSGRIQLDERDRMRVPAKLRAKFKNTEELYLMQGTDQCLFLLNEEGIEKLTTTLNSIPLSNSAGQDFARNILGSVYQLEEDTQGRFVLPEGLKNAVSIDKKLIFVGMGTRIEVWAEEVYEAMSYAKKGATTAAIQGLKESGYEI